MFCSLSILVCERGVDDDAYPRVVVGTARHGIANSFDLQLAFVN